MGALRIPASDLVGWADDMRATHFITLTAGCYPERSFDPDVSFRPDLARLARRIGRELCGLPRRKDPKPGDLPSFAAFYEPTTGSGTPYPHIHGWISLTGNEEEHLRAILRTYWGQDDKPEITSPFLRHYPSRPRAPKAVCRNPTWEPTFDLQPIRSSGAATYSAKGYTRTAMTYDWGTILNII